MYDPYRGHKLNPNYYYPNHDIFPHSKDGFRRDIPVSIKKAKNTIRIIVMGASALYGLGAQGPYPIRPILKNNQTITYYLEKKLNHKFKQADINFKAEVINAGVTGYHTFQHLVYLNSDLLAYNPDWVINFDGHNDFYYSNPSINHWMDYPYSSRVFIDLVNERNFFLGLHLAFRALAPYSYTFNVLERQTKKILRNITIHRLKDEKRARSVSTKKIFLKPAGNKFDNDNKTSYAKTDIFYENYRKCALKTFIRALWQINKLGKLENYNHCVFLQPQIVFEDTGFLTEHDTNIRNITLEKQSNKNYEEQIKKMRKLLPAFFEEYKIPFYDLGDIARYNRLDKDLYFDYCHLSPAGSAIVAERISGILYPQIIEKIQAKQ
jgi:lysophospholipase L1-like esterase